MFNRYARPLSLAVALLLAVQGTVPQAAAQTPAPRKLSIVIVEGDGAINNIRLRTAREPIVQVEDENRRPVAGAVVVFMLPARGPSGVFADGSRMLVVTTDAQGRGAATGLRPNNVAGQMEIRVTASHEGATASATVTQINAVGAPPPAPAGGISGKLIAILAAVGGAAAVGGVLAARGGNGSPAPQPAPAPTSISFGAGTVGPPR